MLTSSKFRLSCIRMLKATLLLVGLMAISFRLSASPSSQETQVQTKAHAIAQFFKLRRCFESNEGQIDASVKYLSQGHQHVFYFTPQEIILILQKGLQEKNFPIFSKLSFQFMGTNPNFIIKGLEEQKCKSHYFIGDDPQKWHANIPNYAKVAYQDLYPGIDAIFYGNSHQLEYDIYVAPNANPQNVRLHIEGARELLIDKDGNLHILTEGEQSVQMQRPFIYQMIEGNKIKIPGEFILLTKQDIGFAIGEYDSTKPLIIDPVLAYSTYLGGNELTFGFDIAVDSKGHAYVTGSTQATNFPTTPGAFQPTLQSPGQGNAFVAKLNRSGTALIYSTYLGGNNLDVGSGIAIDKQGYAYVTGQTSSTNFPTTRKAFQRELRGSINVFLTKLNHSGSALIYSTYVGGSGEDDASSIALDRDQNAYIPK